MKKMIFVRTLAAFLSMLMIISVLPFNIWAEDWIFGGGGKGNDTASESVAIDGLSNKMEIVQLSNDITEIEYVKWGQYITNTDLSATVIGSGTESDPYTITTPEAFVEFSENVNNGEYYKNCDYIYVELSRNIDFGELIGKEPKLDFGGNQIKAEWIPIGTEDRPFAGSFNGNLHEVKNYNISHSVNENGTSTIDAEEQHVGFFGCVKGSEIKNFGAYDFTVDYKYNFNTNIGALVGYSEDTIITDCYANGIIGASFEAINPFNPLNGDNVQEAKSLLESAVSGWALIYDFTKYSYNSELAVIPKNVTAVRFIGDPNKSYNFSIQILDNEYYDIYIELVDFNLVGTSGHPAIWYESTNSAPRDITICSRGDAGSSVTGFKSQPAISAPESAIYIYAAAPLTICGGIGADGADGGNGDNGGVGTDCNDTSNATPGKPGAPGKDGQTGASGAVGITADSLYINVDISSQTSSEAPNRNRCICFCGNAISR